MNITRCPTCGSDQLKRVYRNWTGTYGGQQYTVPDLPFCECPVCGERIFEPGTSGKGSTGLGLYLARAFAERSGGSLELVSRSEGGLFRLRLPAAPE